MGFNKRKLQDQQREAVEKEAAARRVISLPKQAALYIKVLGSEVDALPDVRFGSKADIRVFLPLAPTNAPAAISESARGHSCSRVGILGKSAG